MSKLIELRHKREAKAAELIAAKPIIRDRLLRMARQEPGWERTYDFLMHKLPQRLRMPLAQYSKLCMWAAEEEKIELEEAHGRNRSPDVG